jgi:hypothetical protein
LLVFHVHSTLSIEANASVTRFPKLIIVEWSTAFKIDMWAK